MTYGRPGDAARRRRGAVRGAAIRSRDGFGLGELLVCVIIIGVIISLLVPATCASKERANRVKCASNLRQIGQGLLLYSNEHKCYPRTHHSPAATVLPTPDLAGAASTDPFALSAVGTNNVLAAMFLLVRTADINPEVFTCPSSNHDKDTLGGGPALQRSNFTGKNAVSYSFANMYPQDQAVAWKYQYAPNVPADFAIAADRNDSACNVPALKASSSAADQKKMNSRNHEQEGQNILFNDGHVEWSQHAWVGANRDCVYGSAKTTGTPPAQLADPETNMPTAGPLDPQLDLDTVLLPSKWD